MRLIKNSISVPLPQITDFAGFNYFLMLFKNFKNTFQRRVRDFVTSLHPFIDKRFAVASSEWP